MQIIQLEEGIILLSSYQQLHNCNTMFTADIK